jgi:hypothetical protein
MINQRSGSSCHFQGVNCEMPGMSPGFKPVYMLCVDRDGKVVGERVEIDRGRCDPDSYPAFVRNELCSIRNHVGTVAHSFPERLQVDKN